MCIIYNIMIYIYTHDLEMFLTASRRKNPITRKPEFIFENIQL